VAGGPGKADNTEPVTSGRTVVLFLSDPEAQKLRFQGEDHSAALRGPSRPGGPRSLLGLSSPAARAGSVPGLVASVSATATTGRAARKQRRRLDPSESERDDANQPLSVRHRGRGNLRERGLCGDVVNRAAEDAAALRSPKTHSRNPQMQRRPKLTYKRLMH
jgi:hypothetical protein